MRYSSDGSSTSRHYYYADNRDSVDTTSSLELGGRAALAISKETGKYRDQFRHGPGYGPPITLADGMVIQLREPLLVTAEETITERCEEALGLRQTYGGQHPTEWGEHPQRVLSVDLYPDGSVITASYWLGERVYEMEHNWCDRVEHRINTLCRDEDTEAVIRYRCTHTREPGVLYMEP